MKLNYRTYGQGDPLILLHGIFGSSDNWQTVGKQLSEQYSIFLVDLRNHGLSPHDDQFDYDCMVSDLLDLYEEIQISKSHLLGHSMGGKVAMELSTRHPEMVDKLIVVDIAPKYYPPHHQEIFSGFHSIDLETIKSRKEADDQLSAVIKDAGVRQFLLKNLARDEHNAFVWKLNLPALEKNIDNVGRGLKEGAVFPGQALFLSGSESGYISTDDHSVIHAHFPHAKIEVIKGAGHWVHADKPVELLERVRAFLS